MTGVFKIDGVSVDIFYYAAWNIISL